MWGARESDCLCPADFCFSCNTLFSLFSVRNMSMNTLFRHLPSTSWLPGFLFFGGELVALTEGRYTTSNSYYYAAQKT